jgi:Ion channel
MVPPSLFEDRRLRDLPHSGRGYGLVLLLVGGSIIFRMAAGSSDVALFVSVLLQATTLVVAVWIAGARRRAVRVAAFIASVAALAALVLWIVRGDIPVGPIAIVNGLLVSVAPIVIAAGLVRELRRERAVDAQTLSGVLAIYLLVGMLFSFVYAVIGAVDSGALFAESNTPTAADELYFSFVTLCTVGFGDLTPAGDLARTVAIGEMLIGQIYLVTVVSLIVANMGRRPG